MAKNYLKISGSDVAMRPAGTVPNADALAGVSQVGGAPAPKQPYAMTAATPMSAPVTPSSSLAALGNLTKGTSPDTFISPDEIKPPSTMDRASEWLTQNKGQFISAMGMLSTHFAQTPGQREAGQMIVRSGAQEMEQQRKDAAAKELGYSSSEALEAAGKMATIEKTKAETESEIMRPDVLKEQAATLKAERSLIHPKIDEMTAHSKLLGSQSSLMEQQKYWQQPIPITYGEGENRTTSEIPRGELIQMTESLTKIRKFEQDMKLQGMQINALEGMGDQTVQIGETKVPMALVDKFMPALSAQIHAKATVDAARINAKTLANQLEIERTRALNKEQAEAKSKAVENGIKLMEDINKSTQVTSMNGKELSRTESADAPILRRAFAANAGQMIANGATWQDPRIANQGDQWLTMAVQNKWVTEIDATAMSQGLWRPHGYKDQKPAGSAPGPAAPPEAAPRSTAAPALRLYGLGPADKSYPKGATEQAVESVLKFPGTAVSRVLKDYNDIRNLPR